MPPSIIPYFNKSFISHYTNTITNATPSYNKFNVWWLCCFVLETSSLYALVWKQQCNKRRKRREKNSCSSQTRKIFNKATLTYNNISNRNNPTFSLIRLLARVECIRECCCWIDFHSQWTSRSMPFFMDMILKIIFSITVWIFFLNLLLPIPSFSFSQQFDSAIFTSVSVSLSCTDIHSYSITTILPCSFFSYAHFHFVKNWIFLSLSPPSLSSSSLSFVCFLNSLSPLLLYTNATSSGRQWNYDSKQEEEKEEKRKCEVVWSFSSPFFRGTSTPI